MNNLIFADTETTGLKPKGGHILEIALVAVRLPTFEEVAAWSCPILPPQWPTVRRNMPERVQAMHEKSGLMAEIDTLHVSMQPNLAEVERGAIRFCHTYAPRTPEWQTPLAGANQSFERQWFEEHMPRLLERFHYRPFEVRTITLLQEWVFGEAFEESPHRALPDCRKAIADVRRFLGLQ